MIGKLSKLSLFLNNSKFRKENEILKNIIKEAASKFNAIRKLGFSEDIARKINDICRGYSIWLCNAMINKELNNIDQSIEESERKIAAVKNIEKNFSRTYRENLIQIMDWVHSGLDGDYKEYKLLTFDQLLSESKEWHENLEESLEEESYSEDGNIIIDFRDSSGLGFYWVDLETNSCSEEAERMGHCGRSGYSNLYSLRKFYKKSKNDNTILNKSLLTAAINSDGMVTQLKGPKNSKPNEKYHPYIKALLMYKDEDEDNLVKGFRSEYQTETDFSLDDINDIDVLNEIIENNDSLSKDISTKFILAKKLKDFSKLDGIEGKVELDSEFFEKIAGPSYIRSYLDGEQLFKIYYGEYDETDMFYAYKIDNSELEYLYKDIIDVKNKEIILEKFKERLSNIIDIIKSKSGKIISNEIENLNIDNLYDFIKDTGTYFILSEIEIDTHVSISNEIAKNRAIIEEINNKIIKYLSQYGNIEGSDLIVNLGKLITQMKKARFKDSDIINSINEAMEESDLEDMDEFLTKLLINFIDDNYLKIDPDLYVNINKDDFNEDLYDRLLW